MFDETETVFLAITMTSVAMFGPTLLRMLSAL